MTVPDPAGSRTTGSLTAYLEAAERAAEIALYPMAMGHPIDGRPSLSRLHVRAWDDGAEPEFTGGLSDAESALGGRVAADEIFALPDDVLLVGAPGSGKTSLLRTGVVALTGRRRTGDPPAWVPVLLHASDLTARGSWPEVIAQGVRSRLGTAAEDTWTASFFTNPPAAGSRWLILVDGLDEIVESRTRAGVLAKLADLRLWDPQGSRYRIIVATRPPARQEFGPAKGWHLRRFDLLPLDEDQLSALARGWFDAVNLPLPEEKTDRFRTLLEQGRLTDLARSPLMATMLCRLFIGDVFSGDRPLPPGRHAVYRAFVDMSGRRHYAGAPDEPRGTIQMQAVQRTYGDRTAQAATRVVATSLGLLGRLALAWLDGDTRSAVEVLTDLTSDRRPPELDDRPEAWSAILREIFRETGLLVQRGDDFDFLHPTIGEYLAARCIANDPARRARAHRTVLRLNRLGLVRGIAPPMSLMARFLVAECLVRPDGDEKVRAALRRGASSVWGACFIAQLDADGTPLDPETVETAARTLYRRAMGHRRESYRLTAARALATMRHPRAAEALAAIATDHDLPVATRIPAARTLALSHDESGGPALIELIMDTSLKPEERIRAARTLAGIGDARLGNALFALATEPGLQQHHRITAARILGETGDPEGPAILFAIALDPLTSGFMAISAAHDLAGLGDPRGPELLLDLADDVGLYGGSRVLAARVLATLDDPRGPEALRRLAADDALAEVHRQRAVDLGNGRHTGASGIESSYFGMRRASRRALEAREHMSADLEEMPRLLSAHEDSEEDDGGS
ncbi:NACHT domain-containing protein [Actinoallomurus sp. CA-150999]|uniref:NACHT domain-containing protein n=1 Tax=Actinoallomurus sp. CA-150999 TaxID=3239887 RepID=UPI003D90F0E8